MRIPGYRQLHRAYQNLTPFEFGIFLILGVLLIVSALGLLTDAQKRFSTQQPAAGGVYTEGIVGFPRYINPVLARSDADRDLTRLIYAGLTKLGAGGTVELDLAEDITVSDDGTTYTVSIDPDARFHDGHPLQAEDVVYTINILKDPQIDSPHQADWNGITARVVDAHTVAFDLSEPFRSFPYNLRIGILPKHHWSQESTESFPFSRYNTDPIGAGPYRVNEIERNTDGIPTAYQLTAAKTYTDTPYISSITLQFFADEAGAYTALEAGDITALFGVDPTDVAELSGNGQQIIARPLNRIFAVFFNQNQNEALVDLEVREALAQVVPKQTIVSEVLNGYGNPISGPLPATEIESIEEDDDISTSTVASARQKLQTAGWEETESGWSQDGETLSVSLTTADIPELKQTAELIAQSWEQLGVAVSVTTLPSSELTRDVIRPREYEALLFGQLINPSRDLYPFWHSSGQDDPGLNLALYANTNVDDALAELRTADEDSVQKLETSVTDMITADQPAVFIYTPAFIYILPDEIQSVEIPPITTSADRFSQVEDWYINTTLLWDVFIADEADQPTATSSTATSS